MASKSIFEEYLRSISSKYTHEQTSELGYRTDFEILLGKIYESIKVSRFDHDAKAKDGNKPDFVVVKDEVPLVYIETKDIGVSLDKVEKSEQMARYFGYANLVLTDYLEFRFYRNGLSYGEPIKIADYDSRNRTIEQHPENFELLSQTLLDFAQSHKEPIKSGKHLAKIMGGKAQRIRDNIRHFMSDDKSSTTELTKVYETIKDKLVHDLDLPAFADMYAQTLVYGLFVARYYDESSDTFSRQEARDLIPKSNPLLRDFFDHIVGKDFDERLKYIVDELCFVFSHADVKDLMKEYYQISLPEIGQKEKDPVIHFYEDFLKEYDPQLRKRMGAYYTPLPVVDFIVRSVDEILKVDFGLVSGLADTSKLADGRHKVQILDPAVGTGTFISAVIGNIYKSLGKGQGGRWPAYVQNELLPRLHGFELMMAPYTIAHLKLSMAFRDTGFKYFNDKRLGIYLTNSLEEAPAQNDMFSAFGFAESIAEESKEASKIKNQMPIMVVLGNPPYSGVSSNETSYANSLVEKYKVEPGGIRRLQERKHWLNDDYVKFIALAENLIEKNDSGVVAMITNNGYLDNPTFRGMRWRLANTFDKIFVYDLHGSAKKRETSPDGSKDDNVFDIMQGVGIILAIKTGNKKNGELSGVYHADLYGTRKHKFSELAKFPNWQRLTLDPKKVNFVPRDTHGQNAYEKGFSLDELFIYSSTGVLTMGDNFIINEDPRIISERLEKLKNSEYDEENINREFGLGKNYAKFVLSNNKNIVVDESRIVRICYRPFDVRWTYFDNKVIWRWRNIVSIDVVNHSNLVLGFARSQKDTDFSSVFITSHIMEAKSTERSVQSSFAPLYHYNEDGTKNPNLKPTIVMEIEKIVGQVSPEDILDYIYAILHSPKYRAKYKEFLKIDFPRVPYPKDKVSFRKLVKLGSELRSLHLLESPILNKFVTTYPSSGTDTVEKILYKDGNVYINDEQYFGKVPEVAWNFYIGGYQPAQKWLKDRKGRALTNSDLEHYQKMIVALSETDRIMRQIDKI